MSDGSGMDEGLTGVDVALRRLEEVMDRGFARIEQRFRELAENQQSFREHMDRRFDEAEAARRADRQFLLDIVGNHEGRIQALERRSGPAS